MADRASLAGLRVLVVEDEMMVSLIIEDTLADEDCLIVGPFDRVAEALAAAKTETIDLAVLDVNVAGVKAFAVADALAKRNIPFLFLSGYGQSAMPPDRPSWRVCSKPFKPETLIRMLTEQIAEDGRHGTG